LKDEATASNALNCAVVMEPEQIQGLVLPFPCVAAVALSECACAQRQRDRRNQSKGRTQKIDRRRGAAEDNAIPW
jgi:hypothetical protein